DAALMSHKKGGLHFGYHDHYAVDGGKARIILEVLVTPADVMENLPFLEMLWRARFRWHLRPAQATGDTTYGTIENIVAMEDQGIRAYVPLSEVGRRDGFLGWEAFAYDAERDVYTCPQGAERLTIPEAVGAASPHAAARDSSARRFIAGSPGGVA